MKSRNERGACVTLQADAPSATMAMMVAGSGWSRSLLMVNSALASPSLAPSALHDVSARTASALASPSLAPSALHDVSARTSLLGSFPDDFAQETLGPEDQDEDEEGEGEDVLVLGAERSAREKREIRGSEGLEQA